MTKFTAYQKYADISAWTLFKRAERKMFRRWERLEKRRLRYLRETDAYGFGLLRKMYGVRT